MPTIALAACSDPLSTSTREKIPAMRELLAQAGYSLDERYAQRYAKCAGSYSMRIPPRVRAQLLMELFADPHVDAIVDISGGNLSNEVLDLLDYQLISKHVKPFASYSDNTAVNMALYRYAGLRPTYWNACTIVQRGVRDIPDFLSGKRFLPQVFPDSSPISEQGLCDALMHGDLPIIGGNVRCLAKLAGTRYWPALPSARAAHAIVLESFSQTLPAAVSAFTHLRHAGLFDDARAIILGQFTAIDKNGQRDNLVRIVQESIDIPLLHAPHVGHSADAQPVTIG